MMRGQLPARPGPIARPGASTDPKTTRDRAEIMRRTQTEATIKVRRREHVNTRDAGKSGTLESGSQKIAARPKIWRTKPGRILRSGSSLRKKTSRRRLRPILAAGPVGRHGDGRGRFARRGMVVGRHLICTTAAPTTRCPFKIEDPSHSPGGLILWPLTKDFASKGPENLRSGGPFQENVKPCMWYSGGQVIRCAIYTKLSPHFGLRTGQFGSRTRDPKGLFEISVKP